MENCNHTGEHYTKVLETVATCERTVTICGDCGKELDQPITHT